MPAGVECYVIRQLCRDPRGARGQLAGQQVPDSLLLRRWPRQGHGKDAVKQMALIVSVSPPELLEVQAGTVLLQPPGNRANLTGAQIRPVSGAPPAHAGHWQWRALPRRSIPKADVRSWANSDFLYGT